MLRVVTFNANGIRSATDKGFWEWFDQQDIDILCVQELKAQHADIRDEIAKRPGYESWFHCAQKKGYSGCGIWSRLPVQNVTIGFGVKEFDDEGRYVRVDFPNLSVISVYFPAGTSGDHRQEVKYRFLDAFLEHMEELTAQGREVLVCGDVNIAHHNIDIKNWRGNLKNTGFLPEERAWLTKIFDEYGWVDVFRRLDKRPDQYTWWSQRGQARAKNVGWRIDYHISTQDIASAAQSVRIYKDEKFSDHAPVIFDYDWKVS